MPRDCSRELARCRLTGAIPHCFKKGKTMFQRTKKIGAKVAAVALPAMYAAGNAFAQATDPTSGVAAVQQLKGDMGDYGPLMFGIAIVGTGIGIGVKWIKRTKSAA